MSSREGQERVVTSVERLIAAYDPAFRRTMTIGPAQASDPEALARAMEGLPPVARDLAATLLVGTGAGEGVPARLFQAVEQHGEPLWRMAFLLPRATPSPGATIDPRYYAADCRINPALASVRPFPELLDGAEWPAHRSPSDALWDATVVAAMLESAPAALTRDGKVRKDVERRVLQSIGPDQARWSLALSLARVTGLVREAAGRLYGRPESFPRRVPLLDPGALLEAEVGLAAAALLRVADPSWISLDRLLQTLAARCPEVLVSDRDLPWRAREEPWFRQAADALHRAGVLDASVDADGIRAVRLAGAKPQRPHGFLLTPDLDILVAPGELPGPEYGRLCRVAPYVDGDVVHRHRLTRDGVAADIAAGYDDLIDWLRSRSRTGLPGSVRSTLEQWAASAVRITLLSGVTVLEQEGRFIVTTDRLPSSARLLYYDEPPPARFGMRDGAICVPYGEDALTVRAVVRRLGPALPDEDRCHRWRLAPPPLQDPDRLLDQLRRYHVGPLPAEVEAMVHAAAGRSLVRVEEAVVVHLPLEASEALRRDRVAGPLLGRDLGNGQAVVDRQHLDELRERLLALGFAIDGEAGRTRPEETPDASDLADLERAGRL